MQQEDASLLSRRLLSDVIKGYNVAYLKKRLVYIRHLSIREQADIDGRYFEFYQKAKNSGLNNEADQLELLKKHELWLEKDESELLQLESFVKGLKETKKTLHLLSQMKETDDKIKDAKDKFQAKMNERKDLLGLTCEEYANKKLNEYFIFRSYCKNAALVPLFDESEFDALDIDELIQLISLYTETMKELSPTNLKKVGLSNYFQNLLSLCNEDILQFFGKSIVDLTILQSHVLSYGRDFRYILTTEKYIPEELLNDPEKLMDWMINRQNANKLIGPEPPNVAPKEGLSVEGGGVSLVGATADDYKALGIEGAIRIEDAAKDKGGLSMDDFLKMSNINVSSVK